MCVPLLNIHINSTELTIDLVWPGVTCGMSIYSKASDPIFSFLSVKGQHQNSEKKLICKPASIFLKENLKTKKKNKVSNSPDGLSKRRRRRRKMRRRKKRKRRRRRELLSIRLFSCWNPSIRSIVWVHRPLSLQSLISDPGHLGSYSFLHFSCGEIKTNRRVERGG